MSRNYRKGVYLEVEARDLRVPMPILKTIAGLSRRSQLLLGCFIDFNRTVAINLIITVILL